MFIRHSQDMQILSHIQNNFDETEQSDVFDFPEFDKIVDVMLPKTKKENLNNEGLRKPLQDFQVCAMYNTPFKVQQFIKIARIYYQANYDNRGIITLRNEISKRTIHIYINRDAYGYISIKSYKDENCHKLHLTVETPFPKYNTDLFKKILQKKLL